MHNIIYRRLLQRQPWTMAAGTRRAAAAATVAVSLLAMTTCRAFLLQPLPRASSPCSSALARATTSSCAAAGAPSPLLPQHRNHRRQQGVLRARWGQGEEEGDELDRLMQRLLQGGDERLDVEAWERRRRLEIQAEEEKGLLGKVKGFGRRLLANLPVLFFAPLVLLAAFQLSGLAISVAVVAALVVASFSLPVFALAFIVPMAIFLILGTLAFPIVPFAVFTLAPGIAVIPLFFLLGYLLTRLTTSPTVIREDSLWNSFPFGGDSDWTVINLGGEEDEGGPRGGQRPGQQRGGGRGRGGRAGADDGVIDVKAEEDTDAQSLRDFDERLRQRKGNDGR